MKGIGGNVYGYIQSKVTTRNDIGEYVETWIDVQRIKGWIDLTSGDSKYQSFDAKLQESTHIFIADYVLLNDSISPEKCRMVINGKRYDILLIDNPMEMAAGSQLEIYLKFTGGQ